MAEEGGGGLRERAAALLDFEDGQASFVDGEVVEGGRGVGNDAGAPPAAMALSMYLLPSVEPPFMAKRGGTWADAAGVVLDTGDEGVRVAGRAFGGDFGGKLSPNSF